MTARFVPSVLSDLADWPATPDARYTAIGASVGGDLSGTLLNPTIGAGKVTIGKLGSAVTIDAIAGANATGADWSNNGHAISALSAASSLTGLTIGSGSGHVSGDVVVQTSDLEAARFAFPTSTTASGVNALNSATVNVASTSGFPLSGTFYLSGVAVTYTGINGNSFTGCGSHAATTGGETVTTTSGTLLFNFGDPQSAKTQYNVTTGRHVDIRHGYSATPSTGWVPTVKISRTWQHAATHVVGVNALNSATVNVADTTGFAASGTAYLNGTAFTYTGTTSTSFTGCGNHAATTGGEVVADFPMSGDGAENLAALSVNAVAKNSGAQAVGGFFGATNNSTRVGALSDPSPDACAIYAVGSISGAGSNGAAMSACLIGVKNAGTAALVTTAQVFSFNYVSNSSYSPSAVSDCGFWMNAGGTSQSGAGILFTGSGGQQFDVGIGFMSDGAAGPVKSASIRDDSSSSTSIIINGTHGVGIDMSGAIISGNAIKVPNNVGYAALSSGGASTTLFRLNTSDQFEIRSAMSWLDNVNVVLGTTTGTKIGTATTQKLAFFGATPVVQPSATTELFTSLNALGLIPSGATPITMAADLTLSTHNIVTDTVTGTRIGTANSQKLGFYGATPIVPPAAGIGSNFTANSGTAMNSLSTSTGGLGSQAYTFGDLVRALKNLGLVAS